MSYKNSKVRLVLLLVQIAIIGYTIIQGDDTAKLLALLLLPFWYIAVATWRNE